MLCKLVSDSIYVSLLCRFLNFIDTALSEGFTESDVGDEMNPETLGVDSDIFCRLQPLRSAAAGPTIASSAILDPSVALARQVSNEQTPLETSGRTRLHHHMKALLMPGT